MPNLKISQLTEDTTPTHDDLIVTVHDPAGTPVNKKSKLSSLFAVMQTWVFGSDAGASDTYVVTLSPAPAAYVTGQHYRFKANTANTGACTVNFNGLGAKTIKKAAGGITTDLDTNDIRAGQWVDLVYDGTNMQMQSLLGNVPSGGAGGIGDVVGPGSATDNAVARYDGTTGKLIQNSALTVSDTGEVGFPDGVRQTFNPDATNAGLNVGAVAGDPSAPSNGDLWYDSTANELTARINGGNVALGAGGGGGIGGSTGANDNRILRADGAGGATLQSSAVSIDDSGNTLPVTTSASDLGGNSNRWNQFWANDILATGTGAAGGRIRFFGSGGGAAEIASNANRKSTNFIDGINGNTGTIGFPPHTPSQFGANQNDYTEEGGNSAGFFRWSSDASRTVTGLSISQASGDIHLIINIGSNDIVLAHQSASSTAANRFLCSTGADITLSANQAADIIYDGTTQRWRVFKRN